MNRTAQISALLAPYRDNSANYAAGMLLLYNHLPMAVAALAAMGADEARICVWSAHYAREHALPPASNAELAGRAVWRDRLAANGSSRTLNAALPRLARGIGAAAFHPAIRAGYALERGDDDELACALESWERESLELPAPAYTQPVPAEAALYELARAGIRTGRRGLIANRMAEAANHAAFRAIACHVPSIDALDDLARAAALALAESRDFTALHVLTATAAMRIFAQHLDVPEIAMAGFWRAFAAAACVSGTIPSLDPKRLASVRAIAPDDWTPLLTAATAHHDEHVIKATYTAWRLDCDIHDPVFRTAALRYLSA